MEKTNELAVILPNFFEDVDFSNLNGIIEELGKASGTITEGEKEQAVSIINEWQSGVIERLKMRREEAETLLSTMNINNSWFHLETNQVEAMVDAVGCHKEYEAYLTALKEYDNIIMPDNRVPYLDQTIEQQIEQKNKRVAEEQKYRIRKNKASYDLGIALRNLKFALNEDEKVQELITRVTKFKRNVHKFELDCKEKAQMAKISIAISSEEARVALKQLLSFDLNI